MAAVPPDDAPGNAGLGRVGLLVAATVAVGVLVAVVVVVTVFVSVTGGPDTGVAPVSSTGVVGAADDGYAVWDRNADGSPVRWDPCTPIEVVVAPGGGPEAVPERALVADVRAAIDELRAATGLDLRLAAATSDERPRLGRSTLAIAADGERAWAPVLVGWASPRDDGLPLRDSDRAVAIPVATGRDGDRTYVTGQVALNRERTDLRAGRGDRATGWGATVLHELAHVLGLGHVDDPSQLMHVHPGKGPVELGAGDLAGLAAVGAEGGCRRVPAPRDLDVSVPGR